jgi:hypothetical protein
MGARRELPVLYCAEPISLARVEGLRRHWAMRNGEQTIRDALKKPQAVLCQYLEPDGPNENQTVKQLFGILNDREVIRALED